VFSRLPTEFLLLLGSMSEPIGRQLYQMAGDIRPKYATSKLFDLHGFKLFPTGQVLPIPFFHLRPESKMAS
jgi:hypothetical protein